jgi:hypothetical protein
MAWRRRRPPRASHKRVGIARLIECITNSRGKPSLAAARSLPSCLGGALTLAHQRARQNRCAGGNHGHRPGPSEALCASRPRASLSAAARSGPGIGFARRLSRGILRGQDENVKIARRDSARIACRRFRGAGDILSHLVRHHVVTAPQPLGMGSCCVRRSGSPRRHSVRKQGPASLRGASAPEVRAAAMGLVHRGGRLLRPVLLFAKIPLESPCDAALDSGRPGPHGRTTHRECKLELDFLPEEGSLVEFRLFWAVSPGGAHTRARSDSRPQSAVGLVRSLPGLPSLRGMVGVFGLAPEPRFLANRLAQAFRRGGRETRWRGVATRSFGHPGRMLSG